MTKTNAQDIAFRTIYNEAHRLGMEAANSHNCTPMVVQQHANPLNDNSPVQRQWVVPQGVCGFAWVSIRPGNSPFANWLKKNNLARKAYEGGVQIWVSYFNQSMELKEAYAYAFANYLRNTHGITAYSNSRMD